MAGGAFDVAVRRSFPAFVKRLHIVAGSAKMGLRSVFDCSDKENNQEPSDQE